MTPVVQGTDPWMPNGFPPPSFVVETERISTFAGPRGRWLAAAAILGAVLLIAGVVLIARQKDDKTALKSGSSTTAPGDTTATLPGGSGSTVLDPTAGGADATLPPGGTGGNGAVDPSLTVPGGGGTGTTVGGAGTGAGTTAPPASGAAPGVLASSTSAITIPKVDSSVGPQFGKVTLRNSGGSPVNYTSQSQFPNSLTIDKPSGTLAPGASIELTITLDGTKLGEGPFSGQVGFDAPGAGSPRVTVTSTVGRPPVINDTAGETCATGETATCSKQIKLEPNNNPNATLCTTPWRYRVTVSDESQLKAVQANVGTTSIPLKNGNVASGPSGIWQSDVQYVQQPLHGSLTFQIEAFDNFDYNRKSTPRTVTCPA